MLPRSFYDVVVADPPWNYRQGQRKPPYPTLQLAELAELSPNTNSNALCLMWTTGPQMNDAIKLMTLWGFTYKTIAFVWEKTTKDGRPHCGLGYYTRSCCEFVLMGTKGSHVARWIQDHTVSQLIQSPRREHSRKPEAFFEKLDQMLIPGLRKLEMFARQRRDGWDAMGNQLDHFDALTAPVQSNTPTEESPPRHEESEPEHAAPVLPGS